MNRWLFVGVASLFLFISCQDETFEQGDSANAVRFQISDVKNIRSSSPHKTMNTSTLAYSIPIGVSNTRNQALPSQQLFLSALESDDNRPVFVMKEKDFPAQSDIYLPDEKGGKQSVPLRAALSTSNDDIPSFMVLASLYKEGNKATSTPNFIYNEEVTRVGATNEWKTEHTYYWPEDDRKITFYAYAPKDDAFVVSPKNQQGTPHVSITVNPSVNLQKDLLVAESAEFAGTSNQCVAFNFKHALTAIRFSANAQTFNGTIKKITFKNVLSKGNFSYNNGGEWVIPTTPSDFSLELNKEVTGTSSKVLITDDNQYFLMMPQILPADAAIEIVYLDEGIEKTFLASIGGKVWEKGKIIEYKIGLDAVIEDVFEFGDNITVEYGGDTVNRDITSYRIVRRAGKPDRHIPIAWEAIYSVYDIDEGVWSDWSSAPPTWLTQTTATGVGGDTPKSHAYTISAQTAENSEKDYNSILAANPAQPDKDLSIANGARSTSNCYMVSAPGHYKFPLVYGNAIQKGAVNEDAFKTTNSGSYILSNFVNHLGAPITDPYIYNNPGCAPEDAVVVWHDAKNATFLENVKLDTDKKNVVFDLSAANINQGNAVIAVRDAAGTILWSWHIWVTKKVGNIVTKDKFGNSFEWMNQSVGYLLPTTIKGYPARQAKMRFVAKVDRDTLHTATIVSNGGTVLVEEGHLYFQWGRKDPIMSCKRDAEGEVKKRERHFSPGYDESSNISYSLPNIIKEPHHMHGSASTKINLWDMKQDVLYTSSWCTANRTRTKEIPQKTVYDPCPPGYVVAPSGAYMDLLIKDVTKYDEDTYSNIGVGIKEQYGFYFYTEYWKSGGANFYVPVLGYLTTTGSINSGYVYVNIWSSHCHATSSAICLDSYVSKIGNFYVLKTLKAPSFNDSKYLGEGVRCVRQK